MSISGLSIIGHERGAPGGEPLHGVNPATGEQLEPVFHSASAAEVDRAVNKAAEAFLAYQERTGAERARFLRLIADKLEAVADDLATRGPLETGLPEGRIRMETGRTVNQMRLFADMAEEGAWVNARVDHGNPDRTPLPKPDVRSMLRPVGPVAIFCASNFPVAISAAGGDTAAALAAGCTVVVNAHHGHPGTAEIAGRCVAEAAREEGLPDGVFSLIFGAGTANGAALVKHPEVRAVAFTGSLAGGRALMDMAAARPDPIPVYAEMGSVNPLVILPGALAARSESIAEGLAGSINMGVGQFCTSPGVIVMPTGEATEAFAEKLAELLKATPPATMLHAGIAANYRNGVAARTGVPGAHATVLPASGTSGGCAVEPALFRTDAAAFLANSALRDELFGPATVLVTVANDDELLAVARSFDGQLTATIHGEADELDGYVPLINVFEQKAGRVLFNGFPTGVEVCHAMVHTGPYPAASDARSTSIGLLGIYRFARPVAYQNFPSPHLHAALWDDNPLGIWRLVDGEWTR